MIPSINSQNADDAVAVILVDSLFALSRLLLLLRDDDVGGGVNDNCDRSDDTRCTSQGVCGGEEIVSCKGV